VLPRPKWEELLSVIHLMMSRFCWLPFPRRNNIRWFLIFGMQLVFLYCSVKSIIVNAQEVTTHSAAPSKCIHSSDQKFDTHRTSTGKQNITSKCHTTLLHKFIFRHPHASPEAGTTGPSQHANRCTIGEEIPPTQAHTQLLPRAISK
jgi:hypothetical protein